MDAALRMALGDAFVGFGASFELGIDAAEATGRAITAPKQRWYQVQDQLPAMLKNPSPALPPGIVSVNRLYERIMLGLSAIGTQADAKRGAAEQLLYGRYQAETTLLNALPALFLRPGKREDMTPNALNADLGQRRLRPGHAGDASAARLGAAYHDYVKGFMHIDVPTDGRPITATLVAVPLTPMQWARSRFSDVPYPPSRKSELVLRDLSPTDDRPDPEDIAPLLEGERKFVAQYGPWIPYGFDFAAAMPTHVIGVVEDDAEGSDLGRGGVDRLKLRILTPRRAWPPFGFEGCTNLLASKICRKWQ